MKMKHMKSISIFRWQSILSIMNCQLLIALGLMLVFPVTLSAQDDETEQPQENTVQAIHQKKKKYDTRTVTGRVVDAATQQPIGGCIVAADGVNGYSGLTEDDGTYKVEVPLFSTALYITSPDHNPLRMGLMNGEPQNEAKLHATTFEAEYAPDVNVLNDYTAHDFKYTFATNIKEEVQKQLGGQVYTINRGGMQGIGSVMFIQGLNSLNINAQPLIIIDDVIFDQQNNRTLLHDGFFNDILTNINPADIEKVTVMRNGTALYGA